MYTVLRTEPFDKLAAKMLSCEELRVLEEFARTRLVENPFTGKPLGRDFVREKKIGGKRVYFIVYDLPRIVLLVAVSDKKTQRTVIAGILGALESYSLFIDEVIRRRDGRDHV